MSDPKRELLRHTLATLVYRGRKAIANAPDGFESFPLGEKTRTPLAILAHVNDLLDWGLSMADGSRKWNNSTPGSWGAESERFFAAAQRLDDFLASDGALQADVERLFQGPIADALTHVGQINLMRRLAGGAVRAENYFQADVVAGRVGPDQAPPRREFD